MRERDFGMSDGKPVRLFTLSSAAGLEVSITNYGATVTELWAPDRQGRAADIVLGYDDLEGYKAGAAYLGCMVGRCANRIAHARFEIDGTTYNLAANDGPNHLHGGLKGFDKVVWDAEPFRAPGAEGLRLRYCSGDGEEGYPGAAETTVAYTLTGAGELRLEIVATTDAPTPMNLAHHGYWNLAGHDSGTVHEHEITLDADRYTPVDPAFIPTGALAPVAGTPFDLRTPTPIGRHVDRLPRVGPKDPGGYDHNYVLNGEPGSPRFAARLHDPSSGRTLELYTDQPGVQFYTGNYLNGAAGKRGASYIKRAGLCLETQHFPDAVNHRALPGWPSPVLRPGERYRHTAVYKLSVV